MRRADWEHALSAPLPHRLHEFSTLNSKHAGTHFKDRAGLHCGAMRTTSYALRRCDDNMNCNDARVSYFIQLSPLRHVGASYALHVLNGQGAWGSGATGKGGSHEIPRDSASIFDCAR